MTVKPPPWDMRSLAAERYRALGAQAVGDAPVFLLAALEEAKATMWDQLELVARTQPGDRDGWDVAFDPAICPDEWLPTAAQLGGVAISPTSLAGASAEYVARERARAVDRPALSTGTESTILSAVRRYLEPSAGPGSVIWRPRFDPDDPSEDSAYHVTIVLRRLAIRSEYRDGDEAPELLATFLGELPAGLIGHLRISDERDWQEVYTSWAAWQDVNDDNTDWADVLTP